MKMTDSEKAQLRDRFGHQAFVILTASLVLGEGLAMLWDGVESFPRVLGALCLAGGYYLARCIWAGVYFRPGESPAAWALALAGGGGIAVWAAGRLPRKRRSAGLERRRCVGGDSVLLPSSAGGTGTFLSAGAERQGFRAKKVTGGV